MTTNSFINYPIFWEKVSEYAKKKGRQSRRSPRFVAVFCSKKSGNAKFRQGADPFCSGISDFAGGFALCQTPACYWLDR